MKTFFKNKFRILVAFVLLAIASSLVYPARSNAQDGGTLLAPPEIKGEAVYVPFPVDIKLDGTLSDWVGVPVQTVDRGPSPSKDPAENGSFNFSVAANATTFFITMQMPDRNIITGKHGGDFWNEDSLEFYLNLSGDMTTESYTDTVYQININPGDIGNTDPAKITITGTHGVSSKTQAFVFKTENGWGFEAAMPLPKSPEHGVEIGFQANANGAATADRNVKLIWSLADKADQSYQNPSLFGRAIFFKVGSKDIPLPTPPVQVKKADRVLIAVNQSGYFPDGKKTAVYAREKALPFTPIYVLKDAKTGKSVFAGSTDNVIEDKASGDFVYQIDFTRFSTPGTYILTVDDVESAPITIGNDIYAGLKQDSMAYYYRDRSGTPILADLAGEQWARPAGHTSDSDVPCFKGKDASGKQWDGCDYRLDASGGWYDAGDYGKYVVNGGIAAWTLLNWGETHPTSYLDGSLKIPENANKVSDILDEARWEVEFLLKMQVPEGQPNAGMVHHKLHDIQWGGLPLAVPTTVNNDDPTSGRALMPPSTAATLNLAAVAAQAARIWKTVDPAFADQCLKAAERAWNAANTNPVQVYGNIPGAGGGNYDDSNIQDELYWAASELYITTGSDAYRQVVMDSPYLKVFPGVSESALAPFSWGDTAALGSISLVTVPNGLPKESLDVIREQIVQTADRYLGVMANEGYGIPLPIKGYFWGSNSGVLNNAMIMALAYDITGKSEYLNGVTDSMGYILGRNANNLSFVTGYGTKSAQHPHHRFWANQPDKGFPVPPPGVLVGGPNSDLADDAVKSRAADMPFARRYVDNIDSYSTNEVAINWNAPLVWVTSYLNDHFNAK